MQEPKYENTFRLSILAGLLVVVALAAYATYRLHKIADFKVTKKIPRSKSYSIVFSPGALQLLQNGVVVHIQL